MDIYTLIFLVLAVVIFWKLRSVLGQRTGNERPPFDPFSRRGNDAQGAGGKTIDVTAPLPAHMLASWDLLGFDVNMFED